MHRILLEASMYEDNCFATLTYDPEHVPEGGTLVPKHLSAFMKALRKTQPSPIRFFGVGEYGDTSQRPHYHVALFGFATCERGQSEPHRKICCRRCQLVRDVWKLGAIYLGRLEPHSASYVSGYVTKKLTSKDDERLNGRHPEFARMSRRPGIGVEFMDEVASTLLQHDLENELIDVPASLAHGARRLPLGKFLRGKLRERIGRDKKAPPETIKAIQNELQPLWEAAKLSPLNRSFAFKGLIQDTGLGKRINQEARFKRSNKRGNI